MPCDKFEMDESGKAIVYGEKLNLLGLLKDKHYLVDDQFLKIIQNCSKQNSQDEIVYKVVSWTAERDQGLVSRVDNEDFEEVIKEIRSYSPFQINPN